MLDRDTTYSGDNCAFNGKRLVSIDLKMAPNKRSAYSLQQGGQLGHATVSFLFALRSLPLSWIYSSRRWLLKGSKLIWGKYMDREPELRYWAGRKTYSSPPDWAIAISLVGSRNRRVPGLSGRRTSRHIRFEDQKQSASEVPARLWTIAIGAEAWCATHTAQCTARTVEVRTAVDAVKRSRPYHSGVRTADDPSCSRRSLPCVEHCCALRCGGTVNTPTRLSSQTGWPD